MRAWVKLFILSVISLLAVLLPPAWLVSIAFIVLVFIVAIGASPVRLYRMLLPALPFIVAIAALQALLQGSGTALIDFGLIDLTWGGITQGAISASRILILYLAGSAVTITTGETELAGAIEKALRPIDRIVGSSLGRDISTMMVLTISFIPLVREEYSSIRMAQEARGVRYGGPIAFFKGIVAVAVPLLNSLSGRADAIALAMEARCYGIKK